MLNKDLKCYTAQLWLKRIFLCTVVMESTKKRKRENEIIDDERCTKRNRLSDNLPLEYDDPKKRATTIQAEAQEQKDCAARGLIALAETIVNANIEEFRDDYFILPELKRIVQAFDAVKTKAANARIVDTHELRFRVLPEDVLGLIFQYIPHASATYNNLLLTNKKTKKFLSTVNFVGAEYNFSDDASGHAMISYINRRTENNLSVLFFKTISVFNRANSGIPLRLGYIFRKIPVFHNVEELCITENFLIITQNEFGREKQFPKLKRLIVLYQDTFVVQHSVKRLVKDLSEDIGVYVVHHRRKPEAETTAVHPYDESPHLLEYHTKIIARCLKLYCDKSPCPEAKTIDHMYMYRHIYLANGEKVLEIK